MVFSSAYFVLLFLPVVFLLYFLVPQRYRNHVLLAASVWFYTFGEELLVLIMLFSTVVDFYAAQIIEKGNRKLGLRISIATNLITLGFFKYFNFGIDNLKLVLNSAGINPTVLEGVSEVVLPMGISFYVFQTMSYTIDVYRNQARANKNFVEFTTYVTMFPQLVAGPIVRYTDIKDELRSRSITLENISTGAERFIIGLAKKVIIANTFASVADSIFAHSTNDLSTAMAWLGVFAYSIQIYYDFSGYSDMAIGLGRILGFTIPENFNYPYISKSITEFWRRWHISLSTWFRDYLYIPLGGNRVSTTRMYVNLFVVFFVTGLWHGASWNFVFWGLLHGTFILIEKLFLGRVLKKIPAIISHAYLLVVILTTWVFFRIERFDDSIVYLQRLFIFDSGSQELTDFILYFNWNSLTLGVGVIAIAFSMPLYNLLKKNLKPSILLVPRYALILSLFFLCLTMIAVGGYDPFIYFRF
jgi:alginate O-acetyltransferase complex protein AlgI